MYPRDWLKRQKKKNRKRKNELKSTKEVLMHPRDRLKRIVTKRKYELEFIKKVPVHQEIG